jgi:hypothetical protein
MIFCKLDADKARHKHHGARRGIVIIAAAVTWVALTVLTTHFGVKMGVLCQEALFRERR